MNVIDTLRKNTELKKNETHDEKYSRDLVNRKSKKARQILQRRMQIHIGI